MRAYGQVEATKLFNLGSVSLFDVTDMETRIKLEFYWQTFNDLMLILP